MKLPRNVSGAAVVAALEKQGFVRIRQAGSHVRLAKGPLHVTVPMHDEVAPGTLKSILRQANLSVESLFQS